MLPLQVIVYIFKMHVHITYACPLICYDGQKIAELASKNGQQKASATDLE